jgi:hypothetical protein
MSVCERCEDAYEKLRRELARCQAELDKERLMRRHDATLFEEKLKAFSRREEHYKTMNETLVLALDRDPEEGEASQGKSRSRSRLECSGLSRGRSSTRLLGKENLTPNRGRGVDRLGRLEDELVESKQAQKQLQQENRSLRDELRGLSERLSGGRDWQGSSQESEVLEGDLTLSEYFEQSKRRQQGRREGKRRTANLIECSVCQVRFRPVEFMNHLEQCQ